MRCKKFTENRNGTNSPTTNGRTIISNCVLGDIKTNRFIKDQE